MYRENLKLHKRLITNKLKQIVRRMRFFIDVLYNTPQLNISKLKNHFM